MSLLPAKFQVHVSGDLGPVVRKPVPPPAPHVHAWTPSLSSKDHVVCTCGLVSLREHVVPAAASYPVYTLPGPDVAFIAGRKFGETFRMTARMDEWYKAARASKPVPEPAFNKEYPVPWNEAIPKPPVTGQWIEYSGTTCPVDPETMVRICNRRGLVSGARPAGDWAWKHGTITKYRVVPA